MPFEEKLRALPHLKALTSGLEPLSGYGHDSTLTYHYTFLKLPVLLHKQAKWRFIVKVAVGLVTRVQTKLHWFRLLIFCSNLKTE